MHRKITSLFLALLLTIGPVAPSVAQDVAAAEPRSLLERYTNATQDVILEGLKLVGVRYKLGGNDADRGLDCSSFVQTVFRESIGAYLPRTAREQSEVGQQIDINQLKPGDLVFFNTMRRTFSHVGIYLGDNHFLHAPRTGAEVRVENMANSYWMNRFDGARRIIETR